MPGVDPGTLGAINTFALAAIVVLLVTGLLIAKPSHDFVVRLLTESHGREASMQKELGRNTETLAALGEKIERQSTTIDRLTVELQTRRRA